MRIIRRLKHINHYRDRHGRERYYFRAPGQSQTALPGVPGSAEFLEAYQLAQAGLAERQGGIGHSRTIPGTLNAAVAAYYVDAAFVTLGDSTRQMRRRILEKLRRDHGAKPLKLLTRGHIALMLGKEKPFQALNMLKTLRGLMKFAVRMELRGDDPTAAIERRELIGKGAAGTIHSWDEPEIARFEAAYPVGTQARLALALLLNTGQRRSDVVNMGPQHVRGGVVYVAQQKTGMAKKDQRLAIPLSPELKAILAATPCGNLAFLVTAYGKPYTAAGFGNAFRDWCDAAGLPQCSAHGLRKAQCVRLAEAGCSAPEIAAISGHRSLGEVQRYIAAANQATLARAAMARLDRLDRQN